MAVFKCGCKLSHYLIISFRVQTLIIQPTLDHRWDLTLAFDTLLCFVAHPVADPKFKITEFASQTR